MCSIFQRIGIINQLFRNVQILEHIVKEKEAKKWLHQDIWIIKK
jgi:hypothetical protein